MSTHWYLFPTFSSCAEMIHIHLMTKKPCSYCPESVLIYSFYGSLEQETSVALVTRYRCQSYKLFKISSAKTAWWFNRRSRKGSPFSKNKTSRKESWNNSIFQKTIDISNISCISKQNSFMHSTEHLLQFRLGVTAFSCKNWRCK